MTPELRNKIKELIDLDTKRQKEYWDKHPNGMEVINLGAHSPSKMENIVDSKDSAILTILKGMTYDELAYVMALIWLGRGDWRTDAMANGICDIETFNAHLDHAKETVNDMSVGYVFGKPIGQYLSQGLTYLGL